MFKRFESGFLSIFLLLTGWVHAANAQCDYVLLPTDPPATLIAALQCLGKENQQIKSELNGLKEQLTSVKSVADEALSTAQTATGASDETNEKLDRMFFRPPDEE